ncbi:MULTISPECIES: NAD-dependent epimerase/dehydratase family protein [unclassified Undibacterium]|uniref:NAD-dependent epimerase/dehydratase family protein n=1 Tax=unclassified Undibacterium TaxID=2630295 RepID=UPI002AC9DA9E|nr:MULTISPECIES: NAD-dependent epimerase/dehydratase family protein [unclassified Undibacterium]MEB0137870.1 NAD-dependent epimerase/dehydratase family protein [Undibacterium sp. CCC2.1]MEB0170939.1 NAD-dependent epimerase/dehydratase family protein [Undibacterium sp. CCC1.1]MEB0174984.1 NAD-dependent epimerase/dehydratase family protein [Undibacterium sp. CCC3.4]MEB0215810.1 NAD-dependent epimerase/dehydratase family protein [Undibacterium sp. 5I2]WPX44790.1 NAD-dependent epimerase/dehydratas
MSKKILITGAAGYIGGALAQRFYSRGDTVRGLVRLPEQVAQLEHLGMQAVLGTLDETPKLEQHAAWADVIINAADYEDAVAVSSFLHCLKGSGKSFVQLSGSSVASVVSDELDPHIFTEDSVCPRPGKAHLHAINQQCIAAAADDIRSIVIVPGLIYGPAALKQAGFFAAWAAWAKECGFVPYLGKAENSWSNVHLDDLVDLFVLAIENAAPGSLFFAENGEATLFSMAQQLQAQLKLPLPAQALPLQTFIDKWGESTTATIFGGNSRISALRARTQLHWAPRHTIETSP